MGNKGNIPICARPARINVFRDSHNLTKLNWGVLLFGKSTHVFLVHTHNRKIAVKVNSFILNGVVEGSIH